MLHVLDKPLADSKSLWIKYLNKVLFYFINQRNVHLMINIVLETVFEKPQIYAHSSKQNYSKIDVNNRNFPTCINYTDKIL